MTDKNSNTYVEPIYKVNYVKNDVIDSIYVFKKDKDKDINNFFTQEELEQIRANNTKVIYLNELTPANEVQLNLFVEEDSEKKKKLNKAVDILNTK
jgi:hypothetical protein